MGLSMKISTANASPDNALSKDVTISISAEKSTVLCDYSWTAFSEEESDGWKRSAAPYTVLEVYAFHSLIQPTSSHGTERICARGWGFLETPERFKIAIRI